MACFPLTRLPGNPLGDRGMTELSGALPSMQLQGLNLSGLQASTKGTTTLFECIHAK